PPRDDPEGASPLSRASRREMQQAAGAWWPSVMLPSPDADPDVAAGGYGFGLFVADHIRWGRLVTHGGGYPGFGSNMRWQPSSGLGVIVLANHRYAPSTPLARELMTSLLEASVFPPRPIRPAAALASARADIDRLLAAWDDELAGRLFAMNVELDDPLAHRRDALEKVREIHGVLRSDPEMPEQAETPLHVSWWLSDERGGRVQVEIRLSPEPTAPVQTLNIVSVPAPSGQLAIAAGEIVAGINVPVAALPAGLAIGPDVDQDGLARVMRIVAARFAPVTLGPVVGGDGEASATWWLRSERGELELAVTMNADGAITALSLVQRAPTVPRHGD
ncbi:MAG: serine hydrolase, partial [Candidatus Limnocylindrales bacterium]